MPIKIVEIYTHDLIDNNRSAFFVFGDNDARKGVGGQAAVCRGKPNCIGIRTKKAPLTGEGVYYSDKEFGENVVKIREDFFKVWDALDRGKEVYLPIAGIGTGFAQLQVRAPKTMMFVTEMIGETFRMYGKEE